MSFYHEYVADSNISAPLARYGPEMYFCVADGNVYWVHFESFHNPEVPVLHVKLDTSPIRRSIACRWSLTIRFISRAAAAALPGSTAIPLRKVWSNPEVKPDLRSQPKLRLRR